MSAARLTVLMYHAVGDSALGLDAADTHYTVTRAAFDRHLALMREASLEPASVRDAIAGAGRTHKVAVTFDDGHESNLAAAHRILEAGGSADLFVNSANAGAPGFLGWPALAELARSGFSIQSHGHTHRYFDELTEGEIAHELRTSKREIEDHTGTRVTLFAPPGGRLTPRVAALAQAAGYEAICSSRVGLWRGADQRWSIPRLAVLASTGEAQLRRWITQDPVELARLQLRHQLLSGAKRLMGNRRYDRFRARLLGAGARERRVP